MSYYFAYLFGLLNIVGLQISLLKPNFFWSVIALVLLFNVLFVWLSMRAKFNYNFLNFLISPFVFFLSGAMFLGFLDNWLIKEATIIYLAVINTFFLYTLIIYSYHKYKYRDHSLSNISRILNISSIFFWFTAIFNLQAFLKIPLWLLILGSGVIIYLLIYQFFLIHKINYSLSNLFVFVASGIMLEICFALTWLPLISPVKGALITSIYYFITSLSRHHFQATLSKAVYARYSIVVGIIWFLTLITARWE